MKSTWMRAWLPLCLPLFATACSPQQVLVEKPVAVEVPGPVQLVPVPAELTQGRGKTAIPPDLTYGEALSLWAEDRASLDVLNGQLRAIAELEP